MNKNLKAGLIGLAMSFLAKTVLDIRDDIKNGGVFYSMKADKKHFDRAEEGITLEDMTAWVKRKDLQKGKHYLLIASRACFSEQQLDEISLQEGETLLMFGVYKDGDDRLLDYSFIASPKFDKNILDIIGTEKLAVLELE